MRISTDTLIDRLDDGSIELESMGRRFRVNAGGADILRRLEDRPTPAVIDEISALYQIPRDAAVRDVAAFLNMLSENLLIDLSDDSVPSGTAGVRAC
jgi:hypothetical protein